MGLGVSPTFLIVQLFKDNKFSNQMSEIKYNLQDSKNIFRFNFKLIKILMSS